MINRRWLLIPILGALALAACSAPHASKVASASPTVLPSPPHLNSLSGRVGPDGQVLVVKIDDTDEAHPQIGLENADVVYVEQVEGGLTRLAAVFSSIIPTKIGPVRSARISDIDLLAQYGKVAFSYSGAQRRMLPVIAAANLINLGAELEPSRFYPRDSSRTAPVNLIVKAPELLAKATNAVFAHSIGWNFGAAPSGGEPITGVRVSWPASRYQAKWSVTEHRWVLEHDGSPDLAASGVQLGASTLVIQQVQIHPSPYNDKLGNNTPKSETVGSGSGWILRDGRAFAATWSRTSIADGTHWQLADGTQVPFAPGSIWVFLSDSSKQPVFEHPAVPSSSATTSTPDPSATK